MIRRIRTKQGIGMSHKDRLMLAGLAIASVIVDTRVPENILASELDCLKNTLDLVKEVIRQDDYQPPSKRYHLGQ